MPHADIMSTDKRAQNVRAAFPLTLLGAIALYFVYVSLACFSSLSQSTAGVLGILNESNSIKYFVGLCLFVAAFFALRFISRYIPARFCDGIFQRELSDAPKLGVFALLILGVGALLLVYLFYTETAGSLFGADIKDFVWRHLPPILSVGATALVTLWVLWQLAAKRKLSRAVVFFSYALATVLTYYALLFIVLPDIYHGVAYTESIYNAYHGVPYNITTTGIYGHYGIIYAPFLHLFGGSAVALFRLIAAVGALSTAAAAFAIHKTVSNNYLRVAGVFAAVITVAVLRRSNYWQLQPHRVFFPLLLVAYLAAMAKKNAYGKGRVIGGFVLCAASIVWSTEIGLFCTVAYTVALVVHLWQSDVWYSKKNLLSCLVLVALAAASFLLAILTVGVYNVLCGGSFIFKDFFFPLFESSYMDGSIRADLPFGIQAWIFVLALFLLLIFYSFYHTTFFRKHGNGFDVFAPVCAAIAVVALLNFSYYANRSAYYNMDACCQLAMIALAIFADRYLDTWRGVLKQRMSVARLATAALSLLSAAVLVVLATQITLAPVALIDREREHCFDTKQLETAAAEFKETVPEDYLVIGTGASLLNLQIGRDSIQYYRDLSDLYVGGDAVAEQIAADAVAHGKVAFYLATKEDVALMGFILEHGNFVPAGGGSAGDVTILCYKISD